VAYEDLATAAAVWGACYFRSKILGSGEEILIENKIKLTVI
jgi:hypothetical protein